MTTDPLLNHIAADRQRIANLKQLSCVDEKLVARAIQELTDSLEEALTIHEHVTADKERNAHEYDKIRDERQHYFRLFDSAPHPYVISSLTGLIHEANEACRVLLNFEKNFLVGLPLRGFVAPEERKAFDEFIRVPREERTAQKCRFHFLPHNKPGFTGAVSICRFGEDPHIIWTIEDIKDTTIQSARLPSEEKRCFDEWMLGKEVRWIGEATGIPPTQVLEWVTEWERGIQQKWEPYIPGLEEKPRS